MCTTQGMWYNFLAVAHLNAPIIHNLTDFTPGWWKNFDVDLSLIGSKKNNTENLFRYDFVIYLSAAEQLITGLHTFGSSSLYF